MATLNLDGSNKEKKIGHRRVDETTGQVTYKKKATTDLMKAIQLGIGNSVGSLTSKPTRDVLMQDFSVVETVHFPEYISLTSLPLLELSNPGASGSVFFITEDDEFIIKTVQHKEADFLQKLLPGYYMNLNQNPRTLLPKFYGLYCLQTGGKNIRLCVMNNLLPKAIRKSEKYDLKGSTYKRKASKHELAKSSPTFKDLDFMERNSDGILLESETYEALLKTMKRDVLESFKIMDYSLLLSVYNVDETKRRQLEDGHRQADSTATTPQAVEPSTSTASAAPAAVGGAAAGAEGNVATPGPITRGRSTKYRLQNFSTALESIQAVVAEPADSDDVDVPPGGIPARNVKGERLLLYVGIIDILQSYRLKKKLEHGFKSIVYDGDAISVHRPSFYAHRFQTFFEKEVFKKVDSLENPRGAGPNARFRKAVHAVSVGKF
ncbi:hypothetical protein EB796_006871 [Bugula neritina]|uniref:PIPK domain-containing protein n=1 Tax=Bugula neritina TaxID=10212 RepID=A0A7J7KB31_BUGNE|nr:hypothetical protein EB796_006871 [Bugula neritina]